MKRYEFTGTNELTEKAFWVFVPSRGFLFFYQKPTSIMELLTPVDKRELKLALLNAYGVSWEELKEMDHYDLDDSELDE